MNSLGSLNDTGRDLRHPAAERRQKPALLILLSACLLLAGLVGIGYLIFFRSTPQQPAGQDSSQKEQPASLSTEAQIFEDEPIIKESQAVIGGRVRNLSNVSLENLSLEFELKRRSDGSTEIRTIAIEPDDLAPGVEGKYSFTLPRQEFSGTQLKRLKSASRSASIIFKTAPGARRPKELPPEPTTRTITIERPSPRPKGEEFINTPDTPTRVP